MSRGWGPAGGEIVSCKGKRKQGLLRIRRHEGQHKNRKTILDAIQRELEKRERQAAVG